MPGRHKQPAAKDFASKAASRLAPSVSSRLRHPAPTSVNPWTPAHRAKERKLRTFLASEWAFRSDDNGTVQAMVGAGVGVAVVPRLAVDVNDQATKVLDLDGLVPPRRIALVWHRDRFRSPAARAFAATAQDVCAEFMAARAA